MIVLWVVGLIVAGVLIVLGLGAGMTHVIASKVRRRFLPRGVFVETSVGRIHVVEQGDGPAMVMIHGLGGQIGNFSHGLIGPLSKHYRVIALDRLGSGHSDVMPANFQGVRRHASVIDEVLARMDVETAWIVGHSMGGAVALALAIDHPRRVKGLSLISPLTTEEPRPPLPFRSLQIDAPWLRRLVSHTLAIPFSILRRDRTLDALFGPDPVPTDFAGRGRGLLSLRPESFVSASSDLTHANDDMAWLTANVSQISGPVGLLFGRQDRVLDPTAHGLAFVARHPAAAVRLIDGGHMIPLTRPGAVIDFVRAAEQHAAT